MTDWLNRALTHNAERRKQRYLEGQKQGHRWMLECRDMWDAYDDDAGVYFLYCLTPAAVDQALAALPNDSPDNRLLGIYDLSLPLPKQGAGMSRDEWLNRT
ncbi:MAG: hypothetical protein R3E39_16770 [Anaerolineae bacterium]